MSAEHGARPTDFAREERQIGGWPAGITTWRLDRTWLCRIDNVSPGATVARGRGDTREAAIENALERAAPRLARTRRFAVG